MDQTISNKRKFMCVFSGVLVILFALLYVFSEFDSSVEKMPTDHIFL